MLEVVPITLKEANAFVEQNHRHHGPTVGHKFSIGLSDGEKIVGVAIKGLQQDHERGKKFFNRHGLLKGPARWWRRECFKLAQATFTPVNFWLDMNTTEITAWIREINAVTAEQRQREKG